MADLGVRPLAVLALLALWLLVWLPRRAIPARSLALFRCLLPSWRFFEQLEPAPALQYRLAPNGDDWGEWREALTVPRRTALSLWWNAAGNLNFACQSLVVLPAPPRWMLAQLLPERRFGALLWLRLLAALALGAGLVPGLAPFLLLTQVAICVRFRGTFNGGSDTFSVVLLCALALAELLPERASVQMAALLYIGVQLTLAYFVSGVAKLKHPEWRSGLALAGFLRSGRYGTQRAFLRALDDPVRLTVASLLVLGFECAFPLAWSGPSACSAFIALGLSFHLGTWLLFGLNRFVFVWAAAYPALWWFCQWVG